MRASYILKFVAVILAVALSACGAIQAQREAQVQKQQVIEKQMDIAHIWVTNGDAPAGKPFQVLGPVTYSEPFTPDAIDSHKMNSKLKDLALAKYTNDVDAVIKAHSDVSPDGNTVTVTAEAIKFESSADREAMHRMNAGIVASPK